MSAIIDGLMKMAVKGEVMVGMDLQSVEYDKAKALMAASCSRL
jgi:hypothetical protein